MKREGWVTVPGAAALVVLEGEKPILNVTDLSRALAQQIAVLILEFDARDHKS
jgi:hypothetical protein